MTLTRMNHTVKSTATALAAAAMTAFALTACDAMHDDLDDCPEGLLVSYVYDYNTQRADMFADHVGALTTYVFDDRGYLVTSQTAANTAAAQPLAQHGYTMKFSNLAPGRYQLITLAAQRQGTAITRAEGQNTAYVSSQLQVGDSMSVLRTVLAQGANIGSPATASAAVLDTLWHGMQRQDVEVVAHKVTRATVPLVRDTKNLSLTLRQLDDPAHCDIADFDVYITDHNGTILWNNSVDESTAVTYRPYDERNTWFLANGETTDVQPADETTVQEQVAHANLMFNRLMNRDAADPNLAVLHIVKRSTGKDVATINLANYLAYGRNAFDYYRYSAQEYLDREYDYYMDLIIKGDAWYNVTIRIAILPWSIRFQNEDI